MQRNYPWMFSPADDQDKDGFKLENVGPTFSSFAVVTHKNSVVLYSGSIFCLRITINISLISDLEINSVQSLNLANFGQKIMISPMILHTSPLMSCRENVRIRF